MKKDGKYRFTLQFGSESEKQQRVGELLEKLGNRKSALVVEALNEYLAAHPQLQDPHCKIEVKLALDSSRRGIEEMVRGMVEEKLSAFGLAGGMAEMVPATKEVEMGVPGTDAPGQVMPSPGTSRSEMPERDMLEADIAQMLDNLDLFQ